MPVAPKDEGEGNRMYKLGFQDCPRYLSASTQCELTTHPRGVIRLVLGRLCTLRCVLHA